MKTYRTLASLGLLSWTVLASGAGFAANALSTYCIEKGGTVTPMTAWFQTKTGAVAGLTEPFCTFERDQGYLVIGLSAFASPQPNIAATYMKNLKDISEDEALFQGNAGNPSHNVCNHLGGTTMSFKFSGSFRPTAGGDADICVFGDGSMVSGWTLIYMAEHRKGYDEVKASVRSVPLAVELN